jgi:hypothetical protein
MSDHQPHEVEIKAIEEKKEELRGGKAEAVEQKEEPKSNKRKAQVETDDEEDEDDNEELEAEETEPEPKRQKGFDPNDFETITDAADKLANADVLNELARPDFMTRFAARYGAHSKELHASVYNAAAAMMDSAVLMMQMSEMMLASRWIRSGKPVANFLPRDGYNICNDATKAVERGIAVLLIGLAGHRPSEEKFDIPADAAAPLDTGVLTLLVNKTSVECLLYFWVDVTTEFQSLVFHRRIRDENRAHAFTEFVHGKLEGDIGYKISPKSRGYTDLARVRRVLDVLKSKHRMPSHGELMARPL